MKELLLSEFQPKSQCVNKQTLIKKPKFPVIDIHTHMGLLIPGVGYETLYHTDEYWHQLEDVGVEHIVNLDGVWGEELDKINQKIGTHKNHITTFVWIDVSKIDELDFSEQVSIHLHDAYEKGARGIKMWKVISLNQKDKSGHYIRTDDERLSIVYDTAASLNIPVLMHIADPVAFFEEVDQFNERYEELMNNPDWSFGKAGQLTFNELMVMQDETIRKHPNTTFIIAHFGSYAENLEHVAARLDKFPNMFIDIAARIAELGRVPYSARKFFLEYQDRILFGTDCSPLDLNQHCIYYRFLETFDEYFSYQPLDEQPGQGRWRIYGIGLPDNVLEKIYNGNAKKILNIK